MIICAVVDLGYRYQQASMVNNAAMIAARDMTIHNDFDHALAAALSNGAPAGSSITVTPAACSADADVTVLITTTRDSPTGAFAAQFTVHGKAVARCTE